MNLTFWGINRRGRHVVGHASDTSPAELAEELHGKGFSSTTIKNDAGEVVGEINVHPDTGRRVWWAES